MSLAMKQTTTCSEYDRSLAILDGYLAEMTADLPGSPATLKQGLP